MTNSCGPMDCSPPGSSVHGILQARILQWVAIPSSRGSSRSKDQIHVSCRRNRNRRYFTSSLSVWITLSYEFVPILRSRKGCVCVCVCVRERERERERGESTMNAGGQHGEEPHMETQKVLHSILRCIPPVWMLRLEKCALEQDGRRGEVQWLRKVPVSYLRLATWRLEQGRRLD